MGVNYSASVKTDRLQVVIDAIDGGAASGPGYMEIGAVGWAAVLATIPLNSPCGVAYGGVLVFSFPVEDDAADATGSAAVARIKDSDGNVIVDGLTVGTSGTDIVMASSAITAGQPVTIATGSITHG